MKKITNTILIFAFSIFYLGNISAQIVINEYSCANLNSFADNYNDYEDWVELHNVSNQPVNIGGYYLSDNPDNPDRWKIPVGTTISANGFLLFWASGRDTTINNNFHLNFKIIQTKSTPESFVLANANAEIIDMVEIKKTKLGHARGRMTDGAATWRILTQPSPDASNNNSPKFSAYADRPTFDLDPGFYQNSITVTIENNEPGTAIYYTIDGTEPTQESPVYTAPLVLSQTTVLKSIAVSSDTTMLNSFIEFSTFFINVSHTLPVFSVSANQLLELANGNNELRPYGAIEYFALNGERKGNSYGELNSHGQDSWVNDQRSIDWVSRDEMGYSSVLEERLFSMSDRERFQRFILRAAGDDNYPGNFLPEHNGCAHIRDAYVHNLAKRGGLKLDVRVSEKVILYLNGQYWGVYDVREIPDDHDYTDYYYNQGKYDIQYILTWGQTWAQYGGNEALQNWQTLRNYVLTNDMSIQEKFDNVAAQLDVESLVDYVLVNSVTVCSDWLNYNTGWWRGLKESAKHKKWGYILWDNDATFGYYINYTGIPDTSATAAPCDAESLTNPDVDLNSHIRILNKLRQNVAFNQYYISRQIDLMNTVFSCDNMLNYLDTIVNKIAPEMPMHITRWGGSIMDWNDNVERLRNFIQRRCEFYAEGIRDCYGLTGPYAVSFKVLPEDAGAMKINSLTVTDFPYIGTYLGGVNLSLNAIEDTSLVYLFDKWQSNFDNFNPNDTTQHVIVNLQGSDDIIAHFAEPIPVATNDVDAQNTCRVYPTLCDEQTIVQWNQRNAENIAIQLLDISGRTLWQHSAYYSAGQHQFVVQLHDFPNGAYFIKYIVGREQQQFKISKL